MRSLREWRMTVLGGACLHTKDGHQWHQRGNRKNRCVWFTQIQTQSKTHCNPNSLIIQSQFTRRVRQGKDPVSTVGRSCSQKPGSVTAISDGGIKCSHTGSDHRIIPNPLLDWRWVTITKGIAKHTLTGSQKFSEDSIWLI